MNFQQNTGKTIQQAFQEFHANNPQVYKEFKHLALKAIRNEKTKISFKMILNVIRWEVFIAPVERTLFSNDGKKTRFKINDAYSSHYARLFIKDFPQHKEKIETRKLRS